MSNILSQNKEFIDLILNLKKNGIKDLNLLKTIEEIPRSIFVESSIESKSYLNIALPIDCGQTISQPLIVAIMTQALKLNKNHRVLEIGTGSGYQSAILAKLSRFVYTIERFSSLKRESEKKFKSLKLVNVFCKHADGGLGWKEQAPFDRIIVTASAPEIPNTLLEQLKDDGRMLIPVGEENDDQHLVLIKKYGEKYIKKNLLKVRFVPLLEGKVNK
ncbi:protein-L-isoaspartate(D-aspartate) O-methyltransferase [Rickettsiales bacterium]|nr:protein-L-isoaspartate(D-aspartate) O-methyltransferase [Rickettsiales bacterium]